MRPARGDGISTVALSVMISTIGWSSLTTSPSLTFHATISPSTTPSPMSGRWNSKAISPLQGLPDRAEDAIGVGQVLVLERVRERRVEAGDAQDRCLEVLDGALLDRRDQLGAEAAGARRLVHHDAAAGLPDRR